MEKFNRENLKRKIHYTCGLVFDFSKQGDFFSDKIYIEVATKKNAMYGEIGISKGYRFRLVTNKQYEFCFWSEHDVFAIKTNKEGVEYRFNAYNVEELMNNVINAIYDILPQYKQG
jgi:hypothetical protein